jgi:acetyltransferase-like isoleucine patch superfamily enzyme
MENTSQPPVARGSVHSKSLFALFKKTWIRFWMHFAGIGPAGRFATRLATWFAPPRYSRLWLRYLNPKGFVAPGATLYGENIRLGRHIFIDDNTVLFQREDDSAIDIGAEATVFRGTIVEALRGGRVTIGEKTRLQAHCYLSAAQGSIRIGADVGIAPYCAFYPHDHGTAGGRKISAQPPVVKGDIVVEDGAWLGHGVIVLSGVRIGKGAVIGAGSVVTHDVPENAVACGVPARVVKRRESAAEALAAKEAPLSQSLTDQTTGETRERKGELERKNFG